MRCVTSHHLDQFCSVNPFSKVIKGVLIGIFLKSTVILPGMTPFNPTK